MHLEAISLQPAAPKIGGDVTATTQAPGAPAGQAPPPPSAGGSWMSFLPLLMILPVFFLMNRRNKRDQEARAKMKKGDQVVSQSGLVGELVDSDERFAKVKIGPGVTVRMLTNTLSPLDASAPEENKDDKKSEKNEKADKGASSKTDKPAAAAAK